MENKTTQKPPFPIIQIANTFIERYASDTYIDHLKIQKLCYYAYGWWLAFFGSEPPLSTEGPQVWQYGPVFNSLYGIFKGSKDKWIKEPYDKSPDLINKSEEISSKIIDRIWTRYGHLSGIELSTMTHANNSPWYKEAKEHKFNVPYSHDIDKKKIKAYFANLAEEQQN